MLTETESGQVTFGGNTKGKSIRTGKVGKNPSSCINDVMLVEGLTYNLLNISQLCDKRYKVTFDSQACTIFEPNSETVKFIRKRVNNMYMINLDEPAHENLCFTANKEDLAWLWHRRLGHTSYNILHKLRKFQMVKGLPKFSFKANNKICESCVQGKQIKNSFKSRFENLSIKSLELIHMDLFSPTRSANLSGKKFGYVLVDNFLKFT